MNADSVVLVAQCPILATYIRFQSQAQVPPMVPWKVEDPYAFCMDMYGYVSALSSCISS